MRTFDHPADLASAVGAVLGRSDLSVDQQRIDTFADATGDHQWIHVDRDRARTGPFGTTVAHGYLTLALIPAFLDEAVAVAQVGATLNYGLERVRFPAAVPSGTRVTGTVELTAVRQLEAATDATYRVTIASQESDKPHCVAEPIVRYIWAPRAGTPTTPEGNA